MIYTSYFGNMKKLPDDEYTYVAISATVPEGINCLHYKKLAPSYDNLKQYKEGSISFEQYKDRYINETLSKLKPVDVVTEIKHNLGVELNNKHIVLLCYEKDVKGCHRSIVGKWLSDAGIVVKEIIR